MAAIALTAGLTAALGVGLSGCGTPAAPMPPSLNLPDRVTDLAAVRAGNQVALTWTMPRKNTDKLLLKADVTVRVCRQLSTSGCDPAGDDFLLLFGKGHRDKAVKVPQAASQRKCSEPRPRRFDSQMRRPCVRYWSSF